MTQYFVHSCSLSPLLIVKFCSFPSINRSTYKFFQILCTALLTIYLIINYLIFYGCDILFYLTSYIMLHFLYISVKVSFSPFRYENDQRCPKNYRWSNMFCCYRRRHVTFAGVSCPYKIVKYWPSWETRNWLEKKSVSWIWFKISKSFCM